MYTNNNILFLAYSRLILPLADSLKCQAIAPPKHCFNESSLRNEWVICKCHWMRWINEFTPFSVQVGLIDDENHFDLGKTDNVKLHQTRENLVNLVYLPGRGPLEMTLNDLFIHQWSADTHLPILDASCLSKD